MKIQQIFTPNDIPTVTYVNRAEHKLEQRIREYYNTPNMIVSVAGPSKSGKTVLIKKIVPEDCLISVVGAGISSPENLWDRVLNWMGTPSSVSTSSAHNYGGSVTGEVGGKAKIPFVAEGGAKASVQASAGGSSSETETHARGGLERVIKEIAKSDFVVFIDDFHYIRADIRDEVGRQIKAAAESGVKIFTASVPHRSDDVVRSNPELRGRVAAIDLTYWLSDELTQIARKGFGALNCEISPELERYFANEAFGSPQLMQSICLNTCYTISIDKPYETQTRVRPSESDIREVLLRTSSFTDFSKMISVLHTGPRTRGTERKIHRFVDSTAGDVYRAILLGIKEDPARLSIAYAEILERVRAVCAEDAPVGSSINSALEQMNILAEEIQPGASPVSWDGDTLVLTDPYLLFFLRCSEKIANLGVAK